MAGLVVKRLNSFDRNTQTKGFKAVHQIFKATGAREIVDRRFLLAAFDGWTELGTDPVRSVTSPDFNLHGFKIFTPPTPASFPMRRELIPA